jgi:hypothetical protein
LSGSGWAGALFLAFSCAAPAQVAVLQIQVVAGDGAVHAPGSRAARPLVVRVTDETGKPVAGAAVSFHLPEDGPGGVFAGGLRTEVASTDSGGLASVRGLRLNRNSGSFQIRIFASKEQARAGVISIQYIADARSGVASKARSGRRRWIAVAAVVGAGAAAGILAAGRSDGASAQPPATAASSSAPTIGQPTITVGKP